MKIATRGSGNAIVTYLLPNSILSPSSSLMMMAHDTLWSDNSQIMFPLCVVSNRMASWWRSPHHASLTDLAPMLPASLVFDHTRLFKTVYDTDGMFCHFLNGLFRQRVNVWPVKVSIAECTMWHWRLRILWLTFCGVKSLIMHKWWEQEWEIVFISWMDEKWDDMRAAGCYTHAYNPVFCSSGRNRRATSRISLASFIIKQQL